MPQVGGNPPLLIPRLGVPNFDSSSHRIDFRKHPPMASALQQEIDRVPLWRHRIELPDGTVTPGVQDSPAQLALLHLPEDLSGKSVLDIGCSDGFYSFECERRGANRVLAVDNYSSPLVDSPSGFNVAHKLLDSKVEFRQADLFSLNPEADGPFDIVLFLGVLYHLRHPFLGIERTAQLCNERLILETRLDSPFGLWGALKRRLLGPDNLRPSMRFCERNQVNDDPTNWWTPSAKCVEGMMRASGFCAVEQVASQGWRGIFHGCHPSLGRDGAGLVRSLGGELVAQACASQLGRSVSAAQVEQTLAQVSIPQFAAIKQNAFEAARKQPK
ncbi:MAG: DUF1698 domain-containing protein [Candidatus Latescibacteria bacterium]|nr:DUF1698 domain-containing protein [Candidatus Latescibacterota bacterium]